VDEADRERSGRRTDDEGCRLRRQPSSPSDLDSVIADLQRRHDQLVDFIDAHKDEMRPGQFITAVDYQGRLANRIGRLLRDRQQLAGDQTGALEAAISEALAIVGDAWGVALDAPHPPPEGRG
jgi:hypothetical protein